MHQTNTELWLYSYYHKNEAFCHGIVDVTSQRSDLTFAIRLSISKSDSSLHNEHAYIIPCTVVLLTTSIILPELLVIINLPISLATSSHNVESYNIQ